MTKNIKKDCFLFFCHIWELTTLLGCDWDLLYTSYTFQVHFIHTKGAWHTLYAVDGYMDANPTCMDITRAGLSCVSHLGTHHTVRL